jgi:hypothetical protein
MTILVPLKPVVLVLGLLSGLIFVGFLGSSLLEGKEPFVMDRAQTRHTLVKQETARATPEHKHPQKPPSVRIK